MHGVHAATPESRAFAFRTRAFRMKRLLFFLLLAALGLAAPAARGQGILPSFGGDRAGTSGFQFLKIAVDARSASLGQAAAATAFDATGLFWNPALSAQASGPQASFHYASYFAGVNLGYAAATFPGPAGLTLGLSLQALDAGDMDVTTEFEPFGTGETFGYSGIAAGLTASQALTDLFSYGVTAKYVRESTAGLAAQTVVFDLGIFYRIGPTGASMAVAIRNFGADASFQGDIQRPVLGQDGTTVASDFDGMTPPTTFVLSVAYDVFRASAAHDLSVSAQLINPNDNAENWNVGAEYVWANLLTLRTGYRFGLDEASAPSFGLGLRVPGLGPDVRFDYGFARLDRLGNTHRLGLNLGL